MTGLTGFTVDFSGHRYRFQVVAIYRGGRSEVSDSSARIKLDPEFANQEEIYKPAMTSTTSKTHSLSASPLTQAGTAPHNSLT